MLPSRGDDGEPSSATISQRVGKHHLCLDKFASICSLLEKTNEITLLQAESYISEIRILAVHFTDHESELRQVKDIELVKFKYEKHPVRSLVRMKSKLEQLCKLKDAAHKSLGSSTTAGPATESETRIKDKVEFVDRCYNTLKNFFDEKRKDTLNRWIAIAKGGIDCLNTAIPDDFERYAITSPNESEIKEKPLGNEHRRDISKLWTSSNPFKELVMAQEESLDPPIAGTTCIEDFEKLQTVLDLAKQAVGTSGPLSSAFQSASLILSCTRWVPQQLAIFYTCPIRTVKQRMT